MNRCSKCILPANYPAITFNEEGVCNQCRSYKERQYLGGEALRERILSVHQTQEDRNPDYDCLLALSGGRDSSYLLYYLVKVLNLRVLAFSLDNGFIPEQTMLNMRSMVDALNVKLVIEKNDRLAKCIRHFMLSFAHRPSAAMVGLLCTGCRLGMDTRIPSFARENEIPVIITGSNPLDIYGYKQMIMALNPGSKKRHSFLLGYLLQLARNPMWIMDYNCFKTQLLEYYYHFGRKPGKGSGLLGIAPFNSYIKWEEKEVVSKIETELNWRKHQGTESTWRGDCDIALLKLYLYKRLLGYNDKDEGLSYLVRDGQISREEAMARLEKEGDVAEEGIQEICEKIGFDFSALETALQPALLAKPAFGSA